MIGANKRFCGVHVVAGGFNSLFCLLTVPHTQKKGEIRKGTQSKGVYPTFADAWSHGSAVRDGGP